MTTVSISGTPGTGKTSVAKALAKKLGWRLVELNKLAEKNKFFCGYDRKRTCKIVDIDKVREEIENIRKNIIIESHYAHELPADFVIILRTNTKELKKRMEAKKWSREKVEENLEAEIMGICKEEVLAAAKKPIEIDTSGKKPEKAAEEIIKILSSREKS